MRTLDTLNNALYSYLNSDLIIVPYVDDVTGNSKEYEIHYKNIILNSIKQINDITNVVTSYINEEISEDDTIYFIFDIVIKQLEIDSACYKEKLNTTETLLQQLKEVFVGLKNNESQESIEISLPSIGVLVSGFSILLLSVCQTSISPIIYNIVLGISSLLQIVSILVQLFGVDKKETKITTISITAITICVIVLMVLDSYIGVPFIIKKSGVGL